MFWCGCSKTTTATKSKTKTAATDTKRFASVQCLRLPNLPDLKMIKTSRPMALKSELQEV